MEALLEVIDLTKSYGDKKILEHITLSIKAGEIIALIGVNGAGKTTLMNCILGNRTIDQGKVLYKTQNILEDNKKLNEFGVLMEPKFFEYLNVKENLSLLMQASGYKKKHEIDKKIDELLVLMNLKEKSRKKIKYLSFGQKQRVGIIQAIMHNPKILLLDEPFVGLDPVGKNILKELFIDLAKKYNVGIICSSHDLFDVGEFSDRVIYLNNGMVEYNDKFDFINRFTVILKEKITGELYQKIHRIGTKEIKVTDNRIEFINKDLLNTILPIIIRENMEIDTLKIDKNSLYDFFKREETKLWKPN